jgi:NOL1/NOP2/fmu family ribosome biogenesis protein
MYSKEFYEGEIIRMIKEMNNYEYIVKIYHYVLAKYKRKESEV